MTVASERHPVAWGVDALEMVPKCGHAGADLCDRVRFALEPRVNVQGGLRGGDLGVHLAVGKVDEHPAGEPGLGELSHLLPLVEPVLEDDVGLQLLGLGLVHFPPEELVALDSRDEAGLGEAVGTGGCGHERLTSVSFEYRLLNTSL